MIRTSWGSTTLFLWAAALVLPACGAAQADRICRSGAQRVCECPNGESGRATCHAYGQYWGACRCDDSRPASACGNGHPDLVIASGQTSGAVTFDWVPDADDGHSAGPELWVAFETPPTAVLTTVRDDDAWAAFRRIAADETVIVGAGYPHTERSFGRWFSASFLYVPSVGKPGPTCMAISPLLLDAQSAPGELIITPRWDPPGHVLPVDIVVAGDLSMPQRRQETLIRLANDVLEANGAPILEVRSQHRVPGRTRMRPYDDTYRFWSSIEAGDADVPNLVFVDQFRGDRRDLGGIAFLPGSARDGLDDAAIFVRARYAKGIRYYNEPLAQTVAHEVGHFLGLFHTTERNGRSHDELDSTPECPASRDRDGDGEVDERECRDFGSHNLMFWTGSPDWEDVVLTPEQVRTMRYHPSVRYVPEMETAVTP